MSTKGDFIIRKDGKNKELFIQYDADPHGAGLDVIELVKSVDLEKLYASLVDDEEFDERGKFSFSECKLNVLRGKTIHYRRTDDYFIQDSFFCEYAYVIDLDRQELGFYVGFQKEPQEGNLFGTEGEIPYGMTEVYYPCRLKAVFPLEVVRWASADSVTGAMEQESEGIHRIQRDELEPENDSYTDAKARCVKAIRKMAERLLSLTDQVQGCRILNRRRMMEFTAAVLGVEDSILMLKKEMLMRSAGEKNASDGGGEP